MSAVAEASLVFLFHLQLWTFSFVGLQCMPIAIDVTCSVVCVSVCSVVCVSGVWMSCAETSELIEMSFRRLTVTQGSMC